MTLADFFVAAVEVLHVLLVYVTRGDVCASAKPPLSRDAVPFLCLKVAIVEMHGGAKGVVGVHHRGDTAGEEGHALVF